MRRALFLFACGAIALGAGVACATSEDDPDDPRSSADGGSRLDAGPALDASPDAPFDAYREPPTCSPAGWCLTELPDNQLRVMDIWPFPDRAFAIADSETVGSKVLEWDGATKKWSYIDDQEQNTGYSVMATVWAPNEDEVYYTKLGADFANGLIFGTVRHGRRPVPPATGWTWETLPPVTCDSFHFPVVRGTSPDDVYFLFCNSVHRLSRMAAGDGGSASSWTPEYTVEGDTANVMLADVIGTGPDDLWIVGGRSLGGYGGCGYVARKDAAGYRLVADGDIDMFTNECTGKEGLATVRGAFQFSNQVAAKGQFVGVTYVSDRLTNVTKITAKGDGSITQSTSHPTVAKDILMTSTWGASLDDLWFVTGRAGGAGAVMHGTNVFSDGGTYQYSTVSMNGEPNSKQIIRIRGTSNTNIWAIGDQRALHKTTP